MTEKLNQVTDRLEPVNFLPFSPFVNPQQIRSCWGIRICHLRMMAVVRAAMQTSATLGGLEPDTVGKCDVSCLAVTE